MKLRRKQQGFTIVELLIVILVIGLLAALVITTYTGVQQKERNTERQRDIQDIHTAVETYFAQNQKYPTLANLNDSAWRKANLKLLNPEAVQDPKVPGAPFAPKPTANAYAYAVTAADGAACDNTTKDCAQYTLTATFEGGGIFTKRNLN